MLDEKALVAVVMMSFLIRLFGPWLKVMLRNSAQRSHARTQLVLLRLREEVIRRKGSAHAGEGARWPSGPRKSGIENE